MPRISRQHRFRPGDHLVTDASGDERFASECEVERIGPRKGLLVHRGDLDSPGVNELPQRYRKERTPKPQTGPGRRTNRVYDEDGVAVPGGPADV